MSVAELSSLVVAIIAIASGLGVYLTARRQNTGRVTESNAEVLWKQSQAMYTDVVKERDNAIAQRDKLMSAQSDQIIPILSAVLQATQQVKMAIESIDKQVSEDVSRNEEILKLLRALSKRYMG